MNHSHQQLTRKFLGALLAFSALNAFGGGYYGMAGAEGVPIELLAGSPFQDYFIPSIILFFIVGGAFLTAAVAVFTKHSYAHVAAVGSAVVVFVWLTVQIAIIGYVSWMQPTTAIAGIVILALTKVLQNNSN